jgi:outer membrane protein TolC
MIDISEAKQKKPSKVFFCFVFLLNMAGVYAQQNNSITLEQCYQLARQNYPLIKQKELISQSRDYSIENAARGYWPRWNSGGQLTYQSAVIEIPFKVPGYAFPAYSKTQYKIYGEVDQTVYDGGNINLQKQTQRANADIQEQNLEVQIYSLRERINQIFFGILLINEQLEQNESHQQDLEVVVKTTQVAFDYGSGYKRSLDEAKVELLKAQQTSIDFKGTRRAYLDMLGLFINQPLAENTKFEKPADIVLSSEINRPEMKVYDFQKKLYDIQQKQLSINLRPTLNAFIQGGYSLPSLNTLLATPAFYYIGGLNFNWTLGSLYNLKNNKRILGLNRKTQDIEKETFVFNTNQTLGQQNNDILKMRRLIEKDNEIILLRTSIKNAGMTQAQNGIITVHDYITYVNDESRAKQDLVLHEVQLLLSEYEHKTTSGN